MAEAGDLREEQFRCSVCLDLLRDPVTVNCGHSYCRGCIEGCWDKEEQGGLYSCPQCRHTFRPRPVLGRNTLLAEVVEKVRRADGAAAPPEPGGPHATCDVCAGAAKKKAVKSCLVCLVNYCEGHLKIHKGHRHKMIDSIGRVQDAVCLRHRRILEFYCCTDEQRICHLCRAAEHRGHDTVPVGAAGAERRAGLQQRIRQREEEARELRQAVDSIARSAQAALEDAESAFGEMIRSIERRRSQVRELIRAQEKAAVNEAEGLLERLEQEIEELRRRSAELEQISHAGEDNIRFLQSPGQSANVSVSTRCSFGHVSKSISELKDQLERFLGRALAKMSERVTDFCSLEPRSKGNILNPKQEQVLEISESKNRTTFLQYACELTLDPNTVHKHLGLSERNTAVTWLGEAQSYPEHEDRFEAYLQVLCGEPLSGRCYWEAEWRGAWVHVAVAYKGIGRKHGDARSCLGRNDKSWTLYCSPSWYFFRHNNQETSVAVPVSSTIGVYLDHKAGTLCFYGVSKDTVTLLHRVRTTFTEPLYPAFFVYGKSSLKLPPLVAWKKAQQPS